VRPGRQGAHCSWGRKPGGRAGCAGWLAAPGPEVSAHSACAFVLTRSACICAAILTRLCTDTASSSQPLLTWRPAAAGCEPAAAAVAAAASWRAASHRRRASQSARSSAPRPRHPPCSSSCSARVSAGRADVIQRCADSASAEPSPSCAGGQTVSRIETEHIGRRRRHA